MKVNMHQAKFQISKLGKLAWQGEEIVIAKAGEPYLRLTPYRERMEKRKMGGLDGEFRMSPECDHDDEEIIGFIENSKIFPDED